MQRYDIHPEDEMLLHLRSLGRTEDEMFREYMETGFGIRAAIREMLARVGHPLDRAASLLDFASGHGRASRFLLEDLPAERITVSDLYPTAVEFQAKHFGVHAFASTTDPDRLEIPGPFDIVTCISLFTHLPEPLFVRWLRKLLDACGEDGVLLFTTVQPERSGKDYVFLRQSESRSLDTEIYGSTFVSFEWVERLVREHFPTHAILAYAPQGLVAHQDIYVIGSPGGVLQRVEHLRAPRVEVDQVGIDGDKLRIAGWASSLTAPAPVERLTIRVGDRTATEVELGFERPDVVRAIDNPGALRSGFVASVPFDAPMRGGVASIEVAVPGELPHRRYWRLDV